jgi:hypothetical protein
MEMGFVAFRVNRLDLSVIVLHLHVSEPRHYQLLELHLAVVVERATPARIHCVIAMMWASHLNELPRQAIENIKKYNNDCSRAPGCIAGKGVTGCRQEAMGSFATLSRTLHRDNLEKTNRHILLWDKRR